MPIEARRGCGYRKVGKLYLMGTGISIPCDRLPYELVPCKCCGWAPTQNRVISRLHRNYFRGTLKKGLGVSVTGQHFVMRKAVDGEIRLAPCDCESFCPICYPDDILEEKLMDSEYIGLMWVGNRYYTSREFVQEANTMGVCKAISQLPKGLILGKTWIFLAHPKVPIYEDPEYLKELGEWKLGEEARDKLAPKPPERPAIFYAFTPQRLEMLLPESECTPDKLRQYTERGITIIPVPESEMKEHR